MSLATAVIVDCGTARAEDQYSITRGWVIPPPHCGCGPRVIHGVEVSALSEPLCHPATVEDKSYRKESRA